VATLPEQFLGDTRPCVVTGAGRGIGRAIALHLASTGRPLALCARSEDELDDTAARVRDQGVAVVARVVDVTDAAAVTAFAGIIRDELGSPWAVVNNAAILGPVGPIDEVEINEWLHAILVDVGGVAVSTRAFIPMMRNAGGGRIINLSGAGIGGPAVQPHLSAYTASKGAVAALTETLGRELAGVITVNAVAPGAQPTRLVDEVVRAGPERAGDELYRAMVANQAAPTALDGFFSIIDFLLSVESAWLTGKLLSARWDRVDALREARHRLENTSLLTLRRIDDSMFSEVTP
jgi:NAD(P)-dependent dehydrogenase (short-subunit alcohol dehydrogenase family)